MSACPCHIERDSLSLEIGTDSAPIHAETRSCKSQRQYRAVAMVRSDASPGSEHYLPARMSSTNAVTLATQEWFGKSKISMPGI